MLDQVAGTVVYSTQHLLEPPYEVQPASGWKTSPSSYSVPWQLLAKINGIDDPNSLRPGERLKVVRGPFNAVVNLQKRELTLRASQRLVRRPLPDRRWHRTAAATKARTRFPTSSTTRSTTAARRSSAPATPANPLGEPLDRPGQRHGHPRHRPRRKTSAAPTCPARSASSPQDVEDVYDILATGSQSHDPPLTRRLRRLAPARRSSSCSLPAQHDAAA